MLQNKVVTTSSDWGHCPKTGKDQRASLNEEWIKLFVYVQLIEMGKWLPQGSGPPLLCSPQSNSVYFSTSPTLPVVQQTSHRAAEWVMWSHDLLAACLSSGSVGRALTRASHHLLSINTATTLPPHYPLLSRPPIWAPLQKDRPGCLFVCVTHECEWLWCCIYFFKYIYTVYI